MVTITSLSTPLYTSFGVQHSENWNLKNIAGVKYYVYHTTSLKSLTLCHSFDQLGQHSRWLFEYNSDSMNRFFDVSPTFYRPALGNGIRRTKNFRCPPHRGTFLILVSHAHPSCLNGGSYTSLYRVSGMVLIQAIVYFKTYDGDPTMTKILVRVVLQ